MIHAAFAFLAIPRCPTDARSLLASLLAFSATDAVLACTTHACDCKANAESHRLSGSQSFTRSILGGGLVICPQGLSDKLSSADFQFRKV